MKMGVWTSAKYELLKRRLIDANLVIILRRSSVPARCSLQLVPAKHIPFFFPFLFWKPSHDDSSPGRATHFDSGLIVEDKRGVIFLLGR